MTGNLRSFQWLAFRTAAFLGDWAGSVPLYIFMHTWEQLESTDETWWAPAAIPTPPGYVQRLLADSSTNPLLNVCHPSIGPGLCFVPLVERYEADAIPVPPGFNRSALLQPSNRTHKHHRVWSHLVQLYTLRRVHALADEFYIKVLRQPQDARALILKTRPDVQLWAVPPLQAARARLHGGAPAQLLGASWRGGVSDVAWLASAEAVGRLTGVAAPLGPTVVRPLEQTLRAMLKRLRIQLTFDRYHFALCRLRRGDVAPATAPRVVIGGAQVSLGECIRKG